MTGSRGDGKGTGDEVAYRLACRIAVVGKKVVGASRFERPTTCTPSKCATRLRHAPTRDSGRST